MSVDYFRRKFFKRIGWAGTFKQVKWGWGCSVHHLSMASERIPV